LFCKMILSSRRKIARTSHWPIPLQRKFRNRLPVAYALFCLGFGFRYPLECMQDVRTDHQTRKCSEGLPHNTQSISWDTLTVISQDSHAVGTKLLLIPITSRGARASRFWHSCRTVAESAQVFVSAASSIPLPFVSRLIVPALEKSVPFSDRVGKFFVLVQVYRCLPFRGFRSTVFVSVRIDDDGWSAPRFPVGSPHDWPLETIARSAMGESAGIGHC
jgi:hypothetical protein